MNELIIKYKDSEGNVTDRRISEIAPEGPGTISAFCHLRQEKRTFNIKRILYAVNQDSGERVDDLYKCFGLPSPEENKLTSAIDPSLVSQIPGHSSEAYKGQRHKEKYELFKRFRYPVIANLFKNRFFNLFGHRCFKCGIKEKPYSEIGQPPVLCIDHHIPMILGGHLIPGNLVALCRNCNNKKHDYPPEEFYTPEELDKLKPILEKQGDIFIFTFDWNYWNQDRKGYLLNLGVEPNLVHELLYNHEHPDYIGMPSDDIGITISVNIADIYDNIKK